MSIATEIARINNAKAALKTAIEGKGVTVPADALLDDYAALVDAIVYDGLPAGYTQLEYIESSGTQYIDTDIKTSQTLKTTIVFALKSGFTFGNAKFLFGSSYSSSNMYSVALPSATSLRVPGSNGFVNISIPSLGYGVKHTLSYKSGDIIFDGQQVGTQTNKTNSQNVYLFTRERTSGSQTGNLQLYSAQMYDGDTLVRELVPSMRNSDSVVGMYDKVGGTFLTNSGTGTFSYKTL